MINPTEFTADGVLLTEDSTNRKYEVFHNLDLDEVRGKQAEFNKDAFFACACYSERIQSSAFATIYSTQGGDRIGWFIPSLYYSEPGQFSDQKFLSDFAYAAFKHFWTSANYQQAREIFSKDLDIKSDFSDFLPERLGFIVIAKGSFKQSKLSLVALKLSLLKQGIWAIDDRTDYITLGPSFSHACCTGNNTTGGSQGSKVTARPLSPSCQDVEELLSTILSMAYKEFSGIGGFMYLYQVLEYLMEVNFSEAVQKASRENLTAWKLKKTLSEAANELKRLKNIAHRVNANGAETVIFDKLDYECQSFLKSCDVNPDADRSGWVQKVYKVRNILVHDQLTVLRSGAVHKLASINLHMHQAVLELVFKY